MKKQLYFINNESGVFLPYVLFIATILFIVIFASINMYQKEMKLTYQNMEQLKIEKLFQKGYEKFTQEYSLNKLQKNLTVQYMFPDGDVSIKYIHLNESEGQLHFEIVTKENSLMSIIKPIKLTLTQ